MSNPWANNGRKKSEGDRRKKDRFGKSLHRHCIQGRLKRRGLKIGSVTEALDEASVDWLAQNMPPEMTIAQYIISALVSDAMAEDTQ